MREKPGTTTRLLILRSLFLFALSVYLGYNSGMKKKTSVSLSDEAKRLIELLAKKHGVSKSDVLELALREKADRDGVK